MCSNSNPLVVFALDLTEFKFNVQIGKSEFAFEWVQKQAVT
jgi:hypothetical protein